MNYCRAVTFCLVTVVVMRLVPAASLPTNLLRQIWSSPFHPVSLSFSSLLLLFCCCALAPTYENNLSPFPLTPCSNEREHFASLSPRPKLRDQGNQVDNFTGPSLGESCESCSSAEQNVTLVFGSVTTNSCGPSGARGAICALIK